MFPVAELLFNRRFLGLCQLVAIFIIGSALENGGAQVTGEHSFVSIKVSKKYSRSCSSTYIVVATFKIYEAKTIIYDIIK